jgi:type II secretory pathway component PulF
LPLAHGLLALSEELPRGRLKRSIHELARTLELGVPLDEAVIAHNDRIPPHLRGLVMAGMRSGQIGDLLDQFGDYLRVGKELKRKLWLSLAYPVLTISIAVTLFVFICVFVVSQFESIYNGFGIPLPAVTVALILVARAVNSTWLSAATVIAILFGGLVLARLLLPQPLRRSLAARLPLVGPIWRSTSLAEFCHLLALLLDSRVPLPEALRLTGAGVEDADINAVCGVLANQVESGRSLAESMAERALFPVGLPRLLQWAETQKSLPEILHMAGSMLEARARSQSTFVGIVLNFMCVLMIFSMALVVPALIVPLFNLIARLSG